MEQTPNGLAFTAGIAYFSLNTAYDGGAILAIDCNLNFGGHVVVFNSNVAHDLGGALVSTGSSPSCVIVEACQVYFENNTAQETGGAIVLRSSCFTVNNNRSSIEFVTNSAHTGGAIYSKL